MSFIHITQSNTAIVNEPNLDNIGKRIMVHIEITLDNITNINFDSAKKQSP